MYLFLRIMLVIAIALAACAADPGGQPSIGNPVVGDPPQKVEDTFIPNPPNYTVETWIEGLEIPWALVFLPDGRALVTERPGRIRVIRNGTLQNRVYKSIPEVEHSGEGGLMGLAAHPEFPTQPFLYIMYTYRENNTLYNRVDRLRDMGNTAVFDKTIVEKIPGHRVHDGGRIMFGPDGMLYVCTGDIWQAHIAQEINNLGGKILRFTPDGGIPDDNPFTGSPVYSLGHRNPQGLAWHPESGSLFSSEHGPSGEFGLRDKDIVNVIIKGGNYGWPLVVGDANVEPYLDPIIMWPRATPPSGMTFYNGKLYVATLGSQALIRIDLRKQEDTYEVTAIDRLFGENWSRGTHGRLRDVVVGPDNALYVLTNNRDGRGRPKSGDDRILRLTPVP